MAFHLADMLPAPTVWAYLADESLDSVESDAESRTYLYGCGCVVVRWMESVHCYVRWCATHSPNSP